MLTQRAGAWWGVLVAVGVALVAGCGGGVRPCRSETVFVTLTYAGGTADADQLSVVVTVDGKSMTFTQTRRAGATTDSLEIDFDNGYPVGKELQLDVTATRSGAPLGAGQAKGTLTAGCRAFTVPVTGVALQDGGTVDGTPPDLAGPVDLTAAPPDFVAPGDLVVPPGSDLTAPPLDLTTSPADLTAVVPADLTVKPDLVTPPADLTAPRDFKPAPDLTPPVTFGFIGRVGSASLSSMSTTVTVPVGVGGVGANHTILVAVALFNTTATTASITDSAGNFYAVDTTFGDTSNRVVLLSAINVSPLAAGNSLVVTYPSASRCIVTADEFVGISGRDFFRWTFAPSPAAYSSGTLTTTQPTSLLFGAVVVTSNTSAPTWSSPWLPLPQLTAGGDQQMAAHRVVNVSGTYAATGTINGTYQGWLAVLGSYY